MNLLSVLSKLNKNDVINIRCWLIAAELERDKTNIRHEYLKVPTDLALLNMALIRKGAEAWVRHYDLPSQLTHRRNVTRNTARKIFGEGS